MEGFQINYTDLSDLFWEYKRKIEKTKNRTKKRNWKSAWMKIHMRGTKFKSIGSWEVR